MHLVHPIVKLSSLACFYFLTITVCFASSYALKEGELLRYKAKIGEVEAGNASLILKKNKKKPNQKHTHAILKARTNRFFDKVHRVNNRFESFFSLLTSDHYKMNVDQAGALQVRKILFHPPRGEHKRLDLSVKVNRSYRTKKSLPLWKRQFRVPHDTRDLLSGLYYARSLPYKKDRVYSFHVFVRGRLWEIVGKMVRKEKVYSILGGKDTFLVEAKVTQVGLKNSTRHLRAWITDDEYRVPVKIQGRIPYLGYATGTLTGYRKTRRGRYVDGRQKGRLRSYFGNF